MTVETARQLFGIDTDAAVSEDALRCLRQIETEWVASGGVKNIKGALTVIEACNVLLGEEVENA